MIYFNKSGTNYDVVISSQTLHTIMTALLSLRGSPVVIKVVPYITEHVNLFGVVGSDYQNQPVDSSILKRQVKFIKNWLSESFFKWFDDYEFRAYLEYVQHVVRNEPKLKYLLYGGDPQTHKFTASLLYITKCKYDHTNGMAPEQNDMCGDNLNHVLSICNIINRIISPYLPPHIVRFFSHFESVESIKQFIRGPPVDILVMWKVTYCIPIWTSFIAML